MPKFGDRKQYDEIVGDRVLGKEECPFCVSLSGTEEILWKGKYWFILHNIYPYSGDDQHLMAIPARHTAFSHQLDTDEWTELAEIHRFIKDYYGNNQYFSFTRETIRGRSIEHLHIHFLAGVLKGKFLRKMLELQGFPITEDLKIE